MADHLAAHPPSTGTWAEVGTGSASDGGIGQAKFVYPGGPASHSLALDASAHPIVAWTYEQDVHHGQIYIKRFDGADWLEVGPFSASWNVGISNTTTDSQWPSLSLDDYDTPWVAWSEETATDWEIYVKWFDASSWTGWGSGGGISDTPGDSKFPSLALDSLGRPYVAWTEYVTSTTQIYVKRFDGSNWVEVGSGSASDGGVSTSAHGASDPAVALDDADTPYLAWQDSAATHLDIYVRRFDGENWVEAGTGSASGGGVSDTPTHNSRWPAMDLDSIGYPYVAWTEEDESWLPFPVDQVYVKRFDGTNWIEVGPDSANGPGISGSYYASWDPTISLDSSDTPYVAWYHYDGGNQQIYLRRFDGETWVEVGGSASGGGISNTTGPGGSGTGYSRQPALAIDGFGTPYVAWGESISFEMYVYVRRFAPTWHSYLPLACSE
jgi:hypothetical protein